MATSYGPMGNPFTSRGGAAVNGARSAMGFGPGPAAPGFDNTGANAALEPYGLREPDTFSQPGPAENTSWGQGHPRAGQAIDNALIALGGMGPTGQTAGENISNVARGVMGIEPYRRQYASEQALLPFQYAKEIGGLQAQQAYIKMMGSQAGYYADRGNAMLQANVDRRATAAMKNDIESSKELQIGKDPNGNEAVMRYQYNPETMQGHYVADPNLDPKVFKQQKKIGGLQQTFGADDRGRFIMTAMAQHFKGINSIEEDPGKWDKKAVKAYADAIQSWSRMQPGYMTGMANLGNRQDTQREAQDKAYFTNLHSSMKAPSSKELDDIEMNAAMSTKGTQKEKMAAGQAAKDAAQSKWQKSIVDLGTAFAEFHDLPQDQQDRVGNFQNYWNMRQGQQPQAQASPTLTPPKAGEVIDGYRFKGGNPGDQANYEKVTQ